MEPAVSPLPIPLWPMLALSLALFCATTIAVTISAHYTRQTSASFAQTLPEVAAPILQNGRLRAPRATRAHTNANPMF